MSMMGRSAKSKARVGDPIELRLRNMVRRFAVTVTSAAAVWKVLGIRGLDGEDETVTAEVFQGVGFAARPSTTGSPEVIVVNVGGAKVPVIVASRDHKTLKAVLAELGELAAGDAVIYSPAAVVYVRANGTVEIKTPGGVAQKLATLADLEALRTAIQNTVIAPGDGGAALKAAILAAVWTTGTTVLKAE